MKKFLTITMFCICCIALSAQDSNELLKKLVEKNILTQSEAEELKSSAKEKEKSTTPTTQKVRNLFNSPYIQLGGNGQLMYRYSDIDKVHHDFKPKNLFISLNGKLNDSFRYGFLLEMVNPSVQEFWGEWTAAKTFNVKVGQFKSPFTMESQLVPATLETASYSRTISNLVGYAGEDDVLKQQNTQILRNKFRRLKGKRINPFALIPV
ncbi:MAG: hypothetical protein ACK5KT_04770 [Dysgonomonas sp.]